MECYSLLTYHGATAGTFLALGPQTIAWFYVVLEEIKTCVFCDTHFEIPSYWCRSTKRRNITPLPHPTPAFPFNVMAFPINGMAPGLAAAPGHGQVALGANKVVRGPHTGASGAQVMDLCSGVRNLG